MFLSIAYLFLLIHNTLVQTYVSKIHRHPPCLPPRKKTTERRALSLGGRTAGRASDLRKRALDLMGKEEDRGSPFLIFPSNPSASTTTAPPQRQRGRCCEDAGENSLLKESPPPPPPPPGAKHTQWKPLIIRAVAPSRADPACFTPSQTIAKTVCIPLVI